MGRRKNDRVFSKNDRIAALTTICERLQDELAREKDANATLAKSIVRWLEEHGEHAAPPDVPCAECETLRERVRIYERLLAAAAKERAEGA